MESVAGSACRAVPVRRATVVSRIGISRAGRPREQKQVECSESSMIIVMVVGRGCGTEKSQAQRDRSVSDTNKAVGCFEGVQLTEMHSVDKVDKVVW